MTNLVRFDWAMKHLLRNKANFDVLEGFLSELLHEPNLKIESVLESEGNKETEEDKYNRVDVLVKTQQGQHIIVEVQCYTQWDFLTRILYGTSKTICEYLQQGQAYKNIVKVISVSIVFFDLGVGKDYIYKGQTVFKGIHQGDILGLNEKEQKIYRPLHEINPSTPESIFPEYYIIKISRFHEKVRDKIDEWVYFLKHGEIKKEFSAKGLDSAAKKLDVLKLNETERRAYNHYQESLRDNASFDATLEVERFFERKYGREEGQEEGQKKGLEQGRQEGRTQEKLAIAGKLLASGMEKSQVLLITGLSETEINSLLLM